MCLNKLNLLLLFVLLIINLSLHAEDFKATNNKTLIKIETSTDTAESVTLKSNQPSLRFGAFYTGDLVSNVSGGIQRGTTYLGLANIVAGFDTEKANWWKGGELFVNIGNTHGGEPSKNLVGDIQGVSNIEAGNLTFMYELWFKQRFGNFEIGLGLQDLNVDFASSENGALFTNSSFGIHSSIADNVTSPIFPLTALGLNLSYQIADDKLFKMAVFDGTPDDYENNPYNLNWQINQEQGYLLVSEFQLDKSLIKSKNGTYKLGGYFHQHKDTIDAEQKNGGIYFVADQQVTDRISLFSQIGVSPKKLNNNNLYLSWGLNYQGVFAKRPDDVMGFAVAFAKVDTNIGSETSLEFTYKLNLTDNFYLRPDIQYIINPAATDIKLPNAFVVFLRFGIEI